MYECIAIPKNVELFWLVLLRLLLANGGDYYEESSRRITKGVVPKLRVVIFLSIVVIITALSARKHQEIRIYMYVW